MSNTLTRFHHLIISLLLNHKTNNDISIELSRLGVKAGTH